MAKQAKSFEDYETRNSGGCPRCGGDEKAGAVTVRLMKFKDDSSSRMDQVASRQVSMCEDCTIEVFDDLVGTLNEESNGGSRKPVAARNHVVKVQPRSGRRRRTRA